nr:putative E3 ubiquitin-protein ligase RING1a [Tanacetum cinerariifolium]
MEHDTTLVSARNRGKKGMKFKQRRIWRKRRRDVAPVPEQAEDVSLAMRLQREEFMGAFRGSEQPQQIQQRGRSSVTTAMVNIRAMASRLVKCNKTAKDLWDALARHMLGSKYGEQDRKAAVLYEYETSKATEGEFISKEKVVVFSDSKGSEADDFSELKKITALLAKAFNRRKFYSKPTNNNLRTSSSSQSANKKQEFVKTDDKRVEKKDDEKKRDVSRVKCNNCKKEGHFAKDCKKAKVKDY